MAIVSIVMPARDPGHYFEEAVQSLREQTLSDWELIVVDNASTDGAINACVEKIKDPRIRVMHETVNHGSGGGGCEVAIPLCTGEFIARMDADDKCHPERLALQLATLRAQPNLGMVSCNGQFMDANGNLEEIKQSLHLPSDVASAAEFLMPVMDAATMYRREVQERFPFRSAIRIANDFDRLARVTEAYEVAALPVPLYYYRRHEKAVTASLRKEQIAAAAAIRLMNWRRRRVKVDERYEEESEVYLRVTEQLSTTQEVQQFYIKRMAEEGAWIPAAYEARMAMRYNRNAGTVAGYFFRTLIALTRTPGSLGNTARRMMAAPSNALLEAVDMPDRAITL